MPVVTTRPRGLAAPAGRTPGKGPGAFPVAGQILLASNGQPEHTFSMFNLELPAVEYAAAATSAHAPAPVCGRSGAAARAARKAGVLT